MIIKEITSRYELESAAECGDQFFTESNVSGKFIKQVFIKNWLILIENRMGRVYCLLDNNGAIVGAIGVIIHPDINDGKVVANEAFWFVKPEARGRGLMLFRHLQTEMARIGVDRLIMVHLNNFASNTLKKLYTKDGFVESETSYVKELIHK